FLGEGVPRLRGYGRGDFFVEIEVRIPKSITPRQEELLRELMELESEKGGNKAKKWRWNRRKQHDKDTMPGVRPGAGSP
ncbi:MAG: molecular chaperone DnaJ, partial [Syntrophobacteraceae bacterium]